MKPSLLALVLAALSVGATLAPSTVNAQHHSRAPSAYRGGYGYRPYDDYRAYPGGRIGCRASRRISSQVRQVLPLTTDAVARIAAIPVKTAAALFLVARGVSRAEMNEAVVTMGAKAQACSLGFDDFADVAVNGRGQPLKKRIARSYYGLTSRLNKRFCSNTGAMEAFVMKRALLALMLFLSAAGVTLTPSTSEAQYYGNGYYGGYYRPYYYGGYYQPYYGGYRYGSYYRGYPGYGYGWGGHHHHHHGGWGGYGHRHHGGWGGYGHHGHHHHH